MENSHCFQSRPDVLSHNSQRSGINFIRYRNSNKIRGINRMTLIIGAVCEEGVLLVADTKVVDIGKNTHTHQAKIIRPLRERPVAVGASGLTDVFRRFNRRIPQVFERREKEVRIENEVQLRKVGRSIADFDEPIIQNVQGDLNSLQTEQNIETKPQTSPVNPPYVYTGEDFLTDCRRIVREITEEERGFHPNPIEVLLAFKTSTAQLYQINAYGFETEIDSYTSIGSGSVYVDMFFEKLWIERTFAKTIPLACFVIKFIENMGLDNFVGVGKGDTPQVVVIPNDDNWGDLDFSNKEQFLLESEDVSLSIAEAINKIKLPKLELAEGYSLKRY